MNDYFFSLPINYNPQNAAQKKWPLFIYLHGSGAQGGESVLPCLTNSNDKSRYPTFVYVPHTNDSWDDTKIINQIETLKATYPIDTQRIYLMGYSMGGSGSYTLANDYYTAKGQLFAGIVRMAGQSQTILSDPIVNKTAIWYHIGLADTELRVSVAREAYAFLKSHFKNTATESKIAIPKILGRPGTTWSLSVNGVERVKYTEYAAPVGHGISHLPMKDPELLQWLFSQSIQNR